MRTKWNRFRVCSQRRPIESLQDGGSQHWKLVSQSQCLTEAARVSIVRRDWLHEEELISSTEQLSMLRKLSALLLICSCTPRGYECYQLELESVKQVFRLRSLGYCCYQERRLEYSR